MQYLVSRHDWRLGGGRPRRTGTFRSGSNALECALRLRQVLRESRQASRQRPHQPPDQACRDKPRLEGVWKVTAATDVRRWLARNSCPVTTSLRRWLQGGMQSDFLK